MSNQAANRARMQLLCGTLQSMLETINGLEGLDDGKERLVTKQRNLLYEFKNWLGTIAEFQQNSDLRKFDDAFKAAGWDDQGIRWTREDPKDTTQPMDVFIVEFSDKNHTRWKVA